ncbi:hypothetical protein PybrP1_006776 [[Pythium] brassicae (nom. inval.)]|nr:hypothetical protein PybrP1_006776 [[Pythium] brassicae (nom. inval.)]
MDSTGSMGDSEVDEDSGASSSDAESTSDEKHADASELEGSEYGEGDLSLEREWGANEIQRACFGLIETLAHPHEAGTDEVGEESAFCSACLYAVTSAKMPRTHKFPVSASPLVIGSPLPKLSMLVLAEAKYQDQLQALRTQQELLRQQQQEMQKRKSAQAKQVAAERALARERRRLFLLAMERRQREEELKYGRESTWGSGYPEQDEEETSGRSVGGATTPTLEPSKPKRKKRMKEILPTPFVRTLAHSVIQEQERRKNIRRMVGCYAQDLTPMVNGHKPNCVSMVKKIAPKQQQLSVQRCNRPSKATAAKLPAKRTHQVRLRPLEARAHMSPPQQQYHRSNQFDERELLSASSSPLTAEIKPVSWANALGRDVLGDDCAAPPSLLARFAQLGCVQEEESGDAEPVAPPPPLETALGFDLRLQHKLPTRTELLAPALAAAPAASHHNSADSGSFDSRAVPWEYSSERLASLLEKYNVSVSSAASALRT